jgi:hypothetical protein
MWNLQSADIAYTGVYVYTTVTVLYTCYDCQKTYVYILHIYTYM